MVTKIKPYNPRARDLVADWHVIDASGEVLGRLATRVAWLLMGKHKPGYVRHLSSGDFVVVVNADKVRTTGNKSQQIVYRRHSQYPGNLKEIPVPEGDGDAPDPDSLNTRCAACCRSPSSATGCTAGLRSTPRKRTRTWRR